MANRATAAFSRDANWERQPGTPHRGGWDVPE